MYPSQSINQSCVLQIDKLASKKKCVWICYSASAVSSHLCLCAVAVGVGVGWNGHDQVLIDKETSVQGLRELMLVNVKLEALPKLVLLTRGRPIGKH